VGALAALAHVGQRALGQLARAVGAPAAQMRLADPDLHLAAWRRCAPPAGRR